MENPGQFTELGKAIEKQGYETERQDHDPSQQEAGTLNNPEKTGVRPSHRNSDIRTASRLPASVASAE